MLRMISSARLLPSMFTAAMRTSPESSMSIWQPVSSVIFLITLPPGPMTSRILSGWMCRIVMRGANGDISERGAARQSRILPGPHSRPDGPRLAHGERREVVVQHVRLPGLALELLHPLLVGLRPERGDHERLRLAAREQAGPVRAREQADLDRDRADLVGLAAVCAQPVA